MSLGFYEIEEAIKDAKATQSRVDRQVGSMLRICQGRLRQATVPPSVLAEIKRELRDFNMTTGRWRER